MKILGIDPGSRITGFGVIEKTGNRFFYIASGCIQLKNDPWYERLASIFAGVREIVQQYQPQAFAIEQVFVHKNVQSALKLGQARGAAVVAAVEQGLTVAEYSPRSIKQAVVGYGAAEKSQVQTMITQLLQLNAAPKADAADALAVAFCHGQQVKELV